MVKFLDKKLKIFGFIKLYLHCIPVNIASIVIICREPSCKHLKTDKISHRMSFHLLLWKLEILLKIEFSSDNIFSWILVVHFPIHCAVYFIFPSRKNSVHWVANKDEFERVLVDFFRLQEASFIE